ncbi:MAG TPA: class F sortase [Chloroflexota bacterium]|nr:class F sortase [Chloroflexota bacterium]HEX2987757.1 class F sortase [Chloroflexota bacterium]
MRKKIVAVLVLAVSGLAVFFYQSCGVGASGQGGITASGLGQTAPKGTASPTKSPLRPTPTAVTPDEELSRALGKLTAKPEPGNAARETAVELPKRLRIPSIGVDAGVEYVGLAADGAMDVPRDANHVAWYKLGPRPGAVGNAVIAGHVDWGGKVAVFWQLGQLKPGDTIEVVAADDRKYEFVVQWQKWYDASTAPVQEVFGQAGVAEVTLISCGGEFDKKSRQYLSRIVVRGILR